MAVKADPAAIREILRRDPAWSVYALADLTPDYSGPACWHMAPDGIPAVLLVYRAFHPPVLFAQGAPADLAGLLGELRGEPEFYLTVKPEFAALLRAQGYRIRREFKMRRMVLDAGLFVPRAHTAVRLGPDDLAGLKELYRDGEAAGEAPPFFNADMLRHGVYYGVRDGGALVAAAGTHVCASEEGVAAIGNVYTRRNHRGRGLATQLAAAVTAELLALGIGLVALNVTEANAAAIRIYERLGFRLHCEYREGIAAVRETQLK